MMRTTFTKAEIRKFLVTYFGLNELDYYGKGKEGILNYFSQVGCIQTDPLNIVGNNMDIVLNTRFRNIKPKTVSELLYIDRDLIDGFDKEAAVYMSKDWYKFGYVRKGLSAANESWIRNRGYDIFDKIEYVKEIIRKNGPTCSRDIELGKGEKGPWFSEGFSNIILRHLWTQGILGISYKKGNIPYYDFIENLIPRIIENEELFEYEEMMKWYIQRRLDSLGLYWTKKGAGWLGYCIGDIKKVRELIEVLISENKVIRIEIEDIKREFYITISNYEKLISSLDMKLKSKLSFIAPLDNFIWDREVVKELFDFEYTWEVYVPEAKRKYGYYVLPVLYKDKFIARIEPSRDKGRNDKFEILNIWYEDEKYETDKYKTMLMKELERYNKYFK